jgi:cystathionine beta-synthase
VLDRSLVDQWIKSNDRDSFRVARQLIRQEGLLCGGSSGAAVWAAMQVCRQMTAGQRVVVILPDSIRNYLSKFVSDSWMRQHGFLQSDWELGTMGDLLRTLGPRKLVTLPVDARVGQATELFKRHGISQIPVLDDGVLVGILTELDVMQQLVAGRCTADTTVAEAMVRRVSTVGIHQPSGELPQIFERGEVALVVDQNKRLMGLVTKMDLIEAIAGRKPAPSNTGTPSTRP